MSPDDRRGWGTWGREDGATARRRRGGPLVFRGHEPADRVRDDELAAGLVDVLRPAPVPAVDDVTIDRIERRIREAWALFGPRPTS